VNILLTGFTGNVGGAIADALSDHRVLALVRSVPDAPIPAHVELVQGSLEDLPDSRMIDIEGIVHAAADTAFRSPLETLRQTNVEGTRRLIGFATKCPHLQRFVHLSTVCVSGKSTGSIPEAPCSPMPDFLNGYERSKWEAEELVLNAGLPAEIVRLSIVAGRERDGTVVRLGALHQAIFWLWRGLIPMLPGDSATPVDLISAEHAANLISSVLISPVQSGRIVHAAAGRLAPSLQDVLDVAFTIFAAHNSAWARGAIARPVLVDSRTWTLFAGAAEHSGDALYQRVISDAQTFLPGLLHPRIYETSYADSHSAQEWRPVVERTLNYLLKTNWHRANGTHAC
jgi:nucleoside-diphosphate-sugar epimerase